MKDYGLSNSLFKRGYLRRKHTCISKFDYSEEYCTTCGKIMQFHEERCVLCDSDTPSMPIGDNDFEELENGVLFWNSVKYTDVCVLNFETND